MDDVLLYFSLLHNGDWHKIFNSIKNKQPLDKEKYQCLKQKLKSNYVTILSSNYPPSFREIEQPPYVIYFQGDYNLVFHPNKLAVVGSRDATEYGITATRDFTIALVNKNYLILSGLAKGIDAISHLTALKFNGKTIAIVGQGLDNIYPNENLTLYQEVRKYGLIISEYPDWVMPSKHHFPNRNRLIAALSNGVLITEAKSNSGTLTTVRHGLNYGKDIFCIPYPINHDSACNQLIKQGAKLVESINDILEEL